MQILIVDDHGGVRQLIRELLADCLSASSGRALEFVECANGDEALAAAATCKPALITMDLRMPGMTGIECVKRLRERLPLTCIVVVTQFGNETLHERARIAGADSIVFKDDLKQLQHVTRSYLLRR